MTIRQTDLIPKTYTVEGAFRSLDVRGASGDVDSAVSFCTSYAILPGGTDKTDALNAQDAQAALARLSNLIEASYSPDPDASDETMTRAEVAVLFMEYIDLLDEQGLLE